MTAKRGMVSAEGRSLRRFCAVATVAAALSGRRCGNGQVSAVAPDYGCDPCVYRSGVKVRGFTTSEAIQRAALDMADQMNIDLQMDVYPGGAAGAQQIADDVAAAAAGDDKPDAMIVSSRSAEIAAAIRDAYDDHGVPTFGLDAAALTAKETNGMVGAVGLNYADLGSAAAGAMLSEFGGPGGRQNVGASVGFVSVPTDNGQVPRRTDEIQQAFALEVVKTGAQFSPYLYDVLASDSETNNSTELPFDALFLDGCPEGILVSHPIVLNDVLDTLTVQNCADTVTGVVLPENDGDASTYETTVQAVSDLIANGDVDFAVGHQVSTMGIYGTVMAAIYASTTGLTLAPTVEDEDGRYIIEPIIYTQECVQAGTCRGAKAPYFLVQSTPTEPVAVVDGPTNDTVTMAPSGAETAAELVFPTIRIGGVSHGIAEDEFWDPVYAGARQAARDMAGVELDFARFTVPASEATTDEGAGAVVDQMNARIVLLCTGEGEGSPPVDALFVSLPTDGLLDSVRFCGERGIPVTVINAGIFFSENAFTDDDVDVTNFVGQREVTAGRLAGDMIAQACRGCLFLCLNHAPAVTSLTQRCEGMKNAVTSYLDTNTFFAESDEEPYVAIDVTNETLFIRGVEDAVALSNMTRGDLWNKVALMVGGQPGLVQYASALKELHPGLTMGTFDLSDEVYAGLESGDILFGVDQQPYLQGYWPVVLLATYLRTGQKLQPFHIQSGPSFVETAPTEAELVCMDTNFLVCDANVTLPPVLESEPTQPPQPEQISSIDNAAEPEPGTTGTSDETAGTSDETPPSASPPADTGGEPAGSTPADSSAIAVGVNNVFLLGVSTVLAIALSCI